MSHRQHPRSRGNRFDGQKKFTSGDPKSTRPHMIIFYRQPISCRVATRHGEHSIVNSVCTCSCLPVTKSPDGDGKLFRFLQLWRVRNARDSRVRHSSRNATETNGRVKRARFRFSKIYVSKSKNVFTPPVCADALHHNALCAFVDKTKTEHNKRYCARVSKILPIVQEMSKNMCVVTANRVEE